MAKRTSAQDRRSDVEGAGIRPVPTGVAKGLDRIIHRKLKLLGPGRGLGRDLDWGQIIALCFLAGALIFGILSIYGHLRPKPVSATRPFANLT